MVGGWVVVVVVVGSLFGAGGRGDDVAAWRLGGVAAWRRGGVAAARQRSGRGGRGAPWQGPPRGCSPVRPYHPWWGSPLVSK